MNSKKKILFCVFPIQFFLSHRLPLAQKAREEGYEIHLISTASEGENIIQAEGFSFYPLVISRSKANPLQEISTIIQIYRIYKKIKPDIVHHVTIKPVLYGTLAARLAGVKAIVNAFSGLGHVFTAKSFKISIIRLLVKMAYKLVLRHKNLVSIIQNQDDMEYLISKSIIQNNQTVLIKGSGVDLNEFIPLPEPIGIPVIVLPARLLKDKGVIEFVEAAKILQKLNIKIKMILVGNIDLGNPSSITYEEIDYWVKNKIISHWGFCSNMPETLAKANIVCLPSYREGMPKALIEACASGRAIITTDVPGCREMIDIRNPNGILVPPRDPKSLAKAIEDLVNNPRKRKEMAINGRKMAEKEFSINLVVQKTMNIYRKLLD